MSAARDKGTKAEVAVLGEVQKRWPQALRPAPAGRHDHGDIAGIPAVCVEVKSYLDYARAMQEGLGEAEREARDGELPVAVIRRRNKPPAAWYGVVRLDDLLELIQVAQVARAILGPEGVAS